MTNLAIECTPNSKSKVVASRLDVGKQRKKIKFKQCFMFAKVVQGKNEDCGKMTQNFKN